MNPSEKATDLVFKFLNTQTNTENIEEAKQSALICVKEMFYNGLKHGSSKEGVEFLANVEVEIEKH